MSCTHRDRHVQWNVWLQMVVSTPLLEASRRSRQTGHVGISVSPSGGGSAGRRLRRAADGSAATALSAEAPEPTPPLLPARGSPTKPAASAAASGGTGPSNGEASADGGPAASSGDATTAAAADRATAAAAPQVHTSAPAPPAPTLPCSALAAVQAAVWPGPRRPGGGLSSLRPAPPSEAAAPEPSGVLSTACKEAAAEEAAALAPHTQSAASPRAAAAASLPAAAAAAGVAAHVSTSVLTLGRAASCADEAESGRREDEAAALPASESDAGAISTPPVNGAPEPLAVGASEAPGS